MGSRSPHPYWRSRELTSKHRAAPWAATFAVVPHSCCYRRTCLLRSLMRSSGKARQGKAKQSPAQWQRNIGMSPSRGASYQAQTPTLSNSLACPHTRIPPAERRLCIDLPNDFDMMGNRQVTTAGGTWIRQALFLLRASERASERGAGRDRMSVTVRCCETGRCRAVFRESYPRSVATLHCLPGNSRAGQCEEAWQM